MADARVTFSIAVMMKAFSAGLAFWVSGYGIGQIWKTFWKIVED